MKTTISKISTPVVGLSFSLLLLYISAGFGILNPKNSGWLSVGDGRNIVTWEFFRNTSFPDWVLGRLPDYGLEMSRPVLYHFPALYMYPMRAISSLLEWEFQFIGWIILISLFLQFIFSIKILKIFIQSDLITTLGGLLFLTTPFLLDRFTRQEHYFLLSHWLIFAAFLLALKRDTRARMWLLLNVVSLLIFPYFTAMILAIYAIFIFFELKSSNKVKRLVLNFMLVLSGVFLTLIFLGFLADRSSSGDRGLGIFRANIHTLVDSSGWSRVIPDLPETIGDYEGFSFPGISFLLLIVAVFISQLSQRWRRSFGNLGKSFFPLIISSVFLFIFSLSTNLVIGTTELFSFEYPYILQDIASTFRSTGRFTWPLAYVLMFLGFIGIFKNLSRSLGLALGFFLLILQVFDIYPILSFDKDKKFTKFYETPLVSSFWADLPLCYSAIHQLPAAFYSENHFDFAKLAARNGMGIFPAPVDRFGEDRKQKLINESRNLVRIGNFNPERLYVFREAEFFLASEYTQDQKLALNNLSHYSRAGYIDGFLVIAPNVTKCTKFYSSYQKSLSISSKNDFDLDTPHFDLTSDILDRKYLINGWSGVEPWGTWSDGNWVGLYFQFQDKGELKNMRIKGHGFKWKNGNIPSAKIYLNGSLIGNIEPQNARTGIYEFPIPSEFHSSKSYYLEIVFDKLLSPFEMDMGQDMRKLGFMFNEIIFY